MSTLTLLTIPRECRFIIMMYLPSSAFTKSSFNRLMLTCKQLAAECTLMRKRNWLAWHPDETDVEFIMQEFQCELVGTIRSQMIIARMGLDMRIYLSKKSFPERSNKPHKKWHITTKVPSKLLSTKSVHIPTEFHKRYYITGDVADNKYYVKPGGILSIDTTIIEPHTQLIIPPDFFVVYNYFAASHS